MAKPDNNKPFPVRLGDKKPELQKEAATQERSLHFWINKILQIHLDKKKNNGT
jgi:hypothetical protein